MKPVRDYAEEQYQKMIQDVRDNAATETLQDKLLLSTMIGDLPASEDGDDIISAHLRALLDDNMTEPRRRALRLSMAIELEAMTERYIERMENHALKIRGLDE